MDKGRFLTRRTALVTGGARRLGRAIALALAGAGASVVVHYGTSAGEAEGLCSDIRALGVDSHAVQADLADPESAEALMETAFEAAGTVDILINSASIFPEGSLSELTFEDLESNVAVNAWAPFALSRAFARRVETGDVINMLDTRLVGFDHTHAAYGLSKHMLLLLTQLSALEFAPGIRVNGVAPGLVMPPEGRDESYIEEMGSRLPLKRHGGPADVTGAVLFLLQSGFITGQVIYVDGGRHLRESIGPRT